MPVANTATGDQEQVLTALTAVQAKADRISYFGPSICRICGRMNGHQEFSYNGFTWPAGYEHYIRDHSVAIDLTFKEMLLQELKNTQSTQ